MSSSYSVYTVRQFIMPSSLAALENRLEHTQPICGDFARPLFTAKALLVNPATRIAVRNIGILRVSSV